jgi:hypothetical protein
LYNSLDAKESQKKESQEQEILRNLVQASLKKHYVFLTKRTIKELETLLAQKNWREADAKTSKALLGSAFSKNVSSFSWNNISCPNLRQIDKLWVEKSGGYYGFSVQLKIYRDTGNTIGYYDEQAYNQFGQAVGWKVNGEWLSGLWWGEPKVRGHLVGHLGVGEGLGGARAGLM